MNDGSIGVGGSFCNGAQWARRTGDLALTTVLVMAVARSYAPWVVRPVSATLSISPPTAAWTWSNWTLPTRLFIHRLFIHVEPPIDLDHHGRDTVIFPDDSGTKAPVWLPYPCRDPAECPPRL